MQHLQWEEAFANLKDYIQEFGNAKVPADYITEDGHKLGTWVSNQRQSYKRGKLSPQRQQLLESLPGWAWTARKTKDK